MNYLNKLVHDFYVPQETKTTHKKEKNNGLLSKLKYSWAIRKAKSLEKKGYYNESIQKYLSLGKPMLAFNVYCRAEDNGHYDKIDIHTEQEVLSAMDIHPNHIKRIIDERSNPTKKISLSDAEILANLDAVFKEDNKVIKA